jgi:hypothetical protein
MSSRTINEENVLTTLPLTISSISIPDNSQNFMGRVLDDYSNEDSVSSGIARNARTHNTVNSDKSSSSDDNYTIIPLRSPTLDLSSEQLLSHISSMIESIFSETGEKPVEYGFNIKYTPRYFNNLPAVINFYNLIFELNHVSFVEIAVEKLEQYNVKLFYINPFLRQNRGIVSQTRTTVSDAFKAAIERARKIKLCYTCSIPYDSNFSEYCPCCLLSDFFTYDNKIITCAICHEKTKDFKTLGCGHMFHMSCLMKVKNAKCPCCRMVFFL